MSSNTAKGLFEEFKSLGLDRINRAVDTEESEGLVLDFKRVADNGSIINKLNDESKKTFFEFASGFANVEGGILVWGIGGQNRAEEKFPIRDPQKFAELLDALVPNSLSPALPGIENVHIAEEDGRGYVVTYIPKSPSPPHQMSGKGAYMMRTADSIVAMPHSIVIALANAASVPELAVDFEYALSSSNKGSWFCGLNLFIRNTGRAPAENPAIIITGGAGISAGNTEGGHGFQGVNISIPEWKLLNRPHNAILFELKQIPRIYPGMHVFALSVGFHIQSRENFGRFFDLNYRVFADGFAFENVFEVDLGDE